MLSCARPAAVLEIDRPARESPSDRPAFVAQLVGGAAALRVEHRRGAGQVESPGRFRPRRRTHASRRAISAPRPAEQAAARQAAPPPATGTERVERGAARDVASSASVAWRQLKSSVIRPPCRASSAATGAAPARPAEADARDASEAQREAVIVHDQQAVAGGRGRVGRQRGKRERRERDRHVGPASGGDRKLALSSVCVTTYSSARPVACTSSVELSSTLSQHVRGVHCRSRAARPPAAGVGRAEQTQRDRVEAGRAQAVLRAPRQLVTAPRRSRSEVRAGPCSASPSGPSPPGARLGVQSSGSAAVSGDSASMMQSRSSWAGSSGQSLRSRQRAGDRGGRGAAAARTRSAT